MPRILLVAVLSLTGCGSTVVTRVQSREIGSHLTLRQIRQDTARTARLAEISSTIRTKRVRRLVGWAEEKPHAVGGGRHLGVGHWPAASEEPERKSGYLLVSAQLAYRGLLASGVPAEDWLTEAKTRDTVATYNEALERFVLRMPRRWRRDFPT